MREKEWWTGLKCKWNESRSWNLGAACKVTSGEGRVITGKGCVCWAEPDGGLGIFSPRSLSRDLNIPLGNELPTLISNPARERYPRKMHRFVCRHRPASVHWAELSDLEAVPKMSHSRKGVDPQPPSINRSSPWVLLRDLALLSILARRSCCSSWKVIDRPHRLHLFMFGKREGVCVYASGFVSTGVWCLSLYSESNNTYTILVIISLCLNATCRQRFFFFMRFF